MAVRLRFLVFAASLAAWTAAVGAGGGEPRIEDLEIDIEQQQILVSFRSPELFDEKLELSIRSGLATSVVFEIQLLRPRKAWFDKNVDTHRFTATATYNAVTREIQVHYKLDEQLINSRVVDRFEDLRDVMTMVEKVPAFSLVGRQGDRLRVRVRAELGTRTILFFIPTTRTTDWAESNRFVVDPNGAVLQGGESDED